MGGEKIASVWESSETDPAKAWDFDDNNSWIKIFFWSISKRGTQWKMIAPSNFHFTWRWGIGHDPPPPRVYSDVFKRIQTYADLRWRIETYADALLHSTIRCIWGVRKSPPYGRAQRLTPSKCTFLGKIIQNFKKKLIVFTERNATKNEDIIEGSLHMKLRYPQCFSTWFRKSPLHAFFRLFFLI